MTVEINTIQTEIKSFSAEGLDIAFLEALSNNVVYCLNKYLKENTDSSRSIKRKANNVITDILETLSKEITWAKEELEGGNPLPAKEYLAKAQQQILESMQVLV